MATNIPKRLPVDPRAPLPASAWREVRAALQQGALVILPTETVYGLAADPGRPLALERLYAAKNRPEEKAIARLAADEEQVRREGAQWSPLAARLSGKFWPGPLTLVLDSVAGPIGYRVPDFGVARDLLARYGRALAVTSANRSGAPPACTAEAAVRDVGASAALVLDAGPSPGGVASTVVRVEGHRVKILREGALPRSEIQSALGREGVVE